MKDVKFLMVITKEDESNLLKFSSGEVSALEFKYYYFLRHDYDVKLYFVQYCKLPDDQKGIFYCSSLPIVIIPIDIIEL